MRIISPSDMKRCFKCSKVKPLDDFYAHPGMGDGHLNKCKKCCKSYVRLRHKQLTQNPYWVLSERARSRLKSAKTRAGAGYQRPPRDEQEWNRANRHKKRANLQVSRAIAKGQIVRQNCFCGAVGQAHHPDYSRPLEVMWLCTKHHMEWHVKERERQLLSGCLNSRK